MITNNGVFTVKSIFKALQPSLNELFPRKMVWRFYVQPKVSFFTWEAVCEKILTLDQL